MRRKYRKIAEAFFRKYAPRRYLVTNAGTKPSGEINPLVVEVMKELGIDISKQKSKIITDKKCYCEGTYGM